MPHEWALYLAIIIFIIAVLLRSSPRSPASNDQARLARLEAKLDLLIDKLGVERDTPPGYIGTMGNVGIGFSPPSEAVRDLILKGKKINAIKVFRDQNPGVGLKDAKDAVEAMEAQIKAESY